MLLPLLQNHGYRIQNRQKGHLDRGLSPAGVIYEQCQLSKSYCSRCAGKIQVSVFPGLKQRCEHWLWTSRSFLSLFNFINHQDWDTVVGTGGAEWQLCRAWRLLDREGSEALQSLPCCVAAEQWYYLQAGACPVVSSLVGYSCSTLTGTNAPVLEMNCLANELDGRVVPITTLLYVLCPLPPS